ERGTPTAVLCRPALGPTSRHDDRLRGGSERQRRLHFVKASRAKQSRKFGLIPKMKQTKLLEVEQSRGIVQKLAQRGGEVLFCLLREWIVRFKREQLRSDLEKELGDVSILAET